MVKVTDRDRGMRAFIAAMGQVKGSHTKIGFQADNKYEDGTSLVVVAAANEFGTETIPERSFMRSTYEEQKDEATRILAAEHGAIASGRKDVRVSLAQVGEWFQGKVQEKIHSHPPPPNAPETIARKESSGTLVDSGQMAQSVRHQEVIKGGG